MESATKPARFHALNLLSAQRYAAAALAVFCALALPLVFAPRLAERPPYLYFFVAIVVVRGFWGRGPHCWHPAGGSCCLVRRPRTLTRPLKIPAFSPESRKSLTNLELAIWAGDALSKGRGQGYCRPRCFCLSRGENVCKQEG